MLKKTIPFLEHVFSLLVVFLLLASTTIWSGRLLGYDWLNSSESEQSVELTVAPPTEEEIGVLGLADKKLVPRDSMTWNVVSDSDAALGVVLSSSLFTKEFIGYAGTTPLFVYVDQDGKVQSVAPSANEETPGFFKRAAKGVLDKWNGLSAEEALNLEVDVVSGATYTSKSLISNVRSVLSVYVAADDMANTYEPVIGWPRTIALFFVFALGLLVASRYRGIHWLRLVVLVLNTGVTGFWCGQFLSLSILRGFVQNGTDIVLYLPTVVMLLMALILPFFGKKNYYCLWMCPYGSLQELAWKLPLPKVKVGAKVYKRMSQVRMAILMVLLAMLWMGFGLSVLEYEPFSAFIVSTAVPAVMILAAAFIVIGIFIPHPWCQCVCPVGALLNLAEEKK